MLDVIRRLLATQLLASQEKEPMIDVAVLGREGIDLYQNQLNTPLREVRTYPRFVAAFAGNVATGLAHSLSRETTLAALEAHDGTTIFDLDWRPTLWERANEYGELARTAAKHADIVIGNEEEVAAAAGAPNALLELGVRTLVLKRGERGVLLFHEGREVDVPGHPVEVVNGLGAGDAFVATFVQSLHAGLPVEEAVRRGSVGGAVLASQLACSEAMPTLQELEAALA